MSFIALVDTDINEGLFIQRSEAERQRYIDLANAEVIDVAQTFGIAEDDIQEPAHQKLTNYAKYYALQEFAFDNMRKNNNSGVMAEGNVYKDLFNGSDFMAQRARNAIVIGMFTGILEDYADRAVGNIPIVQA